jgi:alpha-L-rhamnosidase
MVSTKAALLILFAVPFSALQLSAAATLQPARLRCEYRANPQGIDVAAPRLSWELTAAKPKLRGLRQSAYRIVAASSPSLLKANVYDLWDSGKVESAQSVQVVYRGKPLASGAVAAWKVQVWDQAGQVGTWSSAAQWTMGLLRQEDWQGKWIGRDESANYRNPESAYRLLEGARWIWDTAETQAAAPAAPAVASGDRYFRETITLPAGRKIARALCIAGGTENTDVYLNGEPLALRTTAALPPILDIAGLLHPGDNLLAIRGARTRPGRPAGVIAAIRVEFESGEPLVLLSGNRWRAAAKVEDGWQKPGYLDVAWQPAVELGSYGMAPWGAVGITAEHRLAARMVRKEFTIDKKIRRATIHFSGLGLSELYVNGAKVGDHVLSPGLTDYDKRALYVSYDLTNLTTGRNAIGLMLGNGRYYAPRAQPGTRSFGFPKAIVQLNLEFEDGTRSSIVSDESWKLTTNGPIRANNEYDGEEYDARRELPGWDRPGFDDSAWEPAQAVAAPTGALTAEMAEPLRVVETIHAVSVRQLKPGVWIFDMGQNLVGWCAMDLALPAGARVTFRHAETLNPDGSLYVANLRSARAEDDYIAKGQRGERFEPRFTYHGFRYVEVTGLPGTPSAASLEGRVVHDDMAKTADFTSSNSLLNQIHHNIFWGVRGNYRSIPTDCPQRDERQGWLGDRSQVSRSESYMFDVAAFYSKWSQDLADSQHPDGSIPDVAPNYWPLYNDDLTWPSTFIFVPGMLYDQYGDRRVLEHYYPAMRKWLEHERQFVQNGLTSKDQYADWCVPPEDPKLIHSQDPARVTDKTLIASSYYYELLRIVARYARILDKPTEAAELERLAAGVNQAFQLRFFKPTEGIYGNGTQTSSILPLYFQMAPAESRAPVLASLARNITEVTHGHVGTGLVGAQWLMRTLSDNGRADLAYEIATQKTYPGWGYMVEKGATTIWELWNGDTADPAMNSGNHVMQIGDLAVWMYEYLAGIRSDAENPGFRHAIIHPYPAGDLTFVKASHQSLYGALASSWKRDAMAFTLDIVVPPNTTATVWVPAKDAATVTESGKPAAKAAGVKFVRAEDGAAVFEVESGSYAFRAAR